MAREDTVLHMAQPVLWGLFALSCAICTAVVFAYGPEDWSIVRKVMGGVIGGAWSFVCIFVNRMLLT